MDNEYLLDSIKLSREDINNFFTELQNINKLPMVAQIRKLEEIILTNYGLVKAVSLYEKAYIYMQEKYVILENQLEIELEEKDEYQNINTMIRENKEILDIDIKKKQDDIKYNNTIIQELERRLDDKEKLYKTEIENNKNMGEELIKLKSHCEKLIKMNTEFIDTNEKLVNKIIEYKKDIKELADVNKNLALLNSTSNTSIIEYTNNSIDRNLFKILEKEEEIGRANSPIPNGPIYNSPFNKINSK